MTAETDIAHIGMLIGDRTRAAMLTTLLRGDSLPASALAEAVGASRSLASAHLRKLTEGGLVTVEPAGRQRLYRLASAEVAETLEAVMQLAPRPAPVRSLRQANRHAHMRHARLCYDHLAGVFGVGVTEALVGRGALRATEAGFLVTAPGEALFGELDIDIAAMRAVRRPLTRTCMDITEYRHHLAGALGAAIATQMIERRWVTRRTGTRAVIVTDQGHRSAERWLDVELPAAA